MEAWCDDAPKELRGKIYVRRGEIGDIRLVTTLKLLETRYGCVPTALKRTAVGQPIKTDIHFVSHPHPHPDLSKLYQSAFGNYPWKNARNSLYHSGDVSNEELFQALVAGGIYQEVFAQDDVPWMSLQKKHAFFRDSRLIGRIGVDGLAEHEWSKSAFPIRLIIRAFEPDESAVLTGLQTLMLTMFLPKH